MADEPSGTDLQRLDQLIARLRGPDGCPWDREQRLPDLRAYLLEEAHEVADAIDRGDHSELTEELGDLLFQVVFVAQVAGEKGTVALADALDAVERKMIERHPHVFGDESLPTTRDVEAAWARRKLEAAPADRSALDGVPASLPALLRAYRVGQKAAALGFDWRRAEEVLDKVDEELTEVRGELDRNESGASPDPERLIEEIGDLLLSVASLARHLQIDPEAALARANLKFDRRFQGIERRAAERGVELTEADAEAWDELWREVKRDESDR